ncbi:hypothetical protein CC2G_010194 [Coprinopsis cinerea AmutBmut pab1-1]|nr:hypothetical protein CC2G_010194 [Coprinopsis cinerea AmutBmut pab1-1]
MLSENVVSQIPSPTAGSPRKKARRRRPSALRLSSDTSGTTSTLPEYSQAPASGARLSNSTWEAEQIPEDSPPDYPGTTRSTDSAEEADEETELTGSDEDEDQDGFFRNQGPQGPFAFVPQHTKAPQSATTSPRPNKSPRPQHSASPRRQKRFLHQQLQVSSPDLFGEYSGSHKRRHSSVLGRPTSTSHLSHKQSLSLSSTPKSRFSKSQTRERDTDSYLDSLLERSVHALEISNTLLQSSMSTQATMSALFSGSTTSLGAFRSNTTPASHYSPAVSNGGTPTRDYSGFHDVDSALEARAIGLSSKLMRNWDMQESWAEELEKIKNGVDSLFANEGEVGQGSSHVRSRRSRSARPDARPNNPVAPVGSQSLPGSSPLSATQLSRTASSSPVQQGRRPSVDLTARSRDAQQVLTRGDEELVSRSLPESIIEPVVPSAQSQLRLAPQDRSNLVSPPPRALTMYIEATSSPVLPKQPENPARSDLTTLILPSTLGIRSTSVSTPNLLLPNSVANTTAPGSVLPPQVTDTVHLPSTPAYNMLSSLAARGVSNGASSSTSNLLSNAAMSNTLRVPVPGRGSSGDATAVSAPSSFVSSFIHRAASGIRRRNSSPPAPSNLRRSISAERNVPSTRRSPRHHPSSITIPAYRNGSPSPHGSTHPALIRRMTPPTEEESQTEGSDSSSDSCVAKQTVLSLRKILDVQPSPSTSKLDASSSTHLSGPREALTRSTSVPNTRAPSTPSRSSSLNRDPSRYQISPRKPPAFMPRSPAPTASAGTSNATASISRLFTKGVHASSTRPRSPPLRSVMKGKAPRPETPVDAESTPPRPLSLATVSLNNNSPSSTTMHSPTPSLAHFPEFVSRALASGSRSASSSGRSTPKRISFAELPESYSSTKPEGESSGFKTGWRKGGSFHRRKRSGSESSGLNVRRPGSPDEAEKSWWSGWLSPRGLDEREGRDRMYQEDRATRAWGGRMGMALGAGGLGIGHPGMDEWGV